MPVEKDLTESLCTEEAERRIPVGTLGRDERG